MKRMTKLGFVLLFPILLGALLSGGVLRPKKAWAGVTSISTTNPSCLGGNGGSSCHSATSSNGTLSTAVNATVTTSVTVAAGGTFEVDWMYGMRGSTSEYSSGAMLLIPAPSGGTVWSAASGTINYPAITNWNSNNYWDQTDGVGWSTLGGSSKNVTCNAANPFTGTAYPNTKCYLVDYSQASGLWDSGAYDVACDNGSTCNSGASTDRDGVANRMGTDATVTVPADTTPGTYHVYVFGIGHETSGSRSHIEQDITVTVTNTPTLTSPTATAIAETTATLGANITSNGGSSLTARGTCWDTSATPRSNCVAAGGTATGVFTQSRTALTAGSKLYYAGYATNATATGYSADGSFYTEPATPASAVNFTSVAATSLTVNWTRGSGSGVLVVLRDGAAPSADPADGTYTGYTANPVFGSGTALGGGYVVYKSTGASVPITGLTVGHTYYVNVYEYQGSVDSAGGDQGTNYQGTPATGSQSTTTSVPTLTSPTATSIADTTATLGAEITSDGGASLTARGTCWDTTATPRSNCLAEGATATGVFTQARTALTGGSKLYYAGYASNSVGTAYSSDGSFYTEPASPAAAVNFTSVTATSLTVNWTRGSGDGVLVVMRAGAAPSAAPTDGAYTTYSASTTYGGGATLGGGYVVYKDTGSSVTVGGLNPGVTYYVQVYEYQGSVDTSGGDQGSNYQGSPASNSQTTAVGPPTLTSPSALSIGATTALLGANITADGGMALTARGTCWDTTATPRSNCGAEGGTGTGVFSHSRTALPVGTKLYHAAYATNGLGTSYSPDGSFYTEPASQATAVNFTAIASTSLTVNWTRGDGAGVLVVMREGAAPSAAPADGSYTGYAANATYGSGTSLGGGYVVYQGSGASVPITGLSSGHSYYVAIYEYSGSVDTSGEEQGTNYKPLPATEEQMTTPYCSDAASITAWRSRASGNWATASVWQCLSGSTWYDSPVATPTTGAAITILSGDTVTVATDVTVDNVTIDGGGQVTINSNRTWTINAGTGTDLTVNGTLVNSGTLTQSGGSTMAVGAGGVYQHAVNGGTIPTATWDPDATLLLTGLTTTAPSSGMTQSFGNVTYNCTGQTAQLTLGQPTAITGNLTVASTGSGGPTSTLHFHFQTSSSTLNIGKDLIITGGGFEPNHSTATTTINIGGSFLQTGGGIGKWHSSGGTITFNFTGTKVGGPWNIAGNLDNSSISSGYNRVYNVNAAYTLSDNVTLNTPVSGYTSTFNVPGSGTGSLDLDVYNFTGTNTYANTLTVGTNGTLYVGGGSNFPSGFTSYALTNGTVNYNRDGAQTVSAQTYGNLTLSVSGVKTLTSVATISGNLTLSGTATATQANNLSIGGNLSVGDGTTFTVGTATNYTLAVTGTTTIGGGSSGVLTINGTGAKTFTGDVTVSAGATWNNSANVAVALGGSLANSGTFTAGSGTHTFTGVAKTLSGTLAIPTATFSGTGTAYGNSGIFTAATLLTLTSPAVLTNNGTLTAATALSGTGTLTQGATGILNIGGTSGLATLTATADGNMVNYTGTTQTIKATTYHDITLSSGAKTLGGATAVTGNWANSGTLTPGTYTVTFNGTATQSITGSNAWYGLAITGTTRTVQIESGATQTVANSLNFTADASNLLTLAPTTGGSAWNLTYNGSGLSQSVSRCSVSWSNASGGAAINATNGSNIDGLNNSNWVFTSPSYTSAQTGPWNSGSTWVGGNVPSGTFSSVIIASGHTVTVDGATDSLYNLTVNAGGALNTGSAAAVSGSGILTLQGGGAVLVGASNFPSFSASNLDSASTVTYGGGTQSVAAQTYGNLTTSGSGTKTLGGATSIAGTLTIDSGITLATGANTLTFPSGSIGTINGTLKAEQSLANSGTLTFNANSTYQHAVNSLAIPVATWNSAATLYITGITTGGTLTGTDRALGNVRIECALGSELFFTNSSATVVNGDFLVVKTSTAAPDANIHLAWSAAAVTAVINGSLRLEAPSGYAAFEPFHATGTLTINGGYNQTGNGGLGYWESNTGRVFTLNFNGSGTIGGRLIYGAAATVTFNPTIVAGKSYSLSANTVHTSLAANLTSTFTVNGTLDLGAYTLTSATSGVTTTFTMGSAALLKVGGASNFPSGFDTITTTSGTVEYNRADVQTVAGRTYGNLTLSGSGTKTLGGTTTVGGNLTISAGTLDVSSSNRALSVAGNWTNTPGGTSGFLARSGTVTFNGTTQAIHGNNTWYGLAITGTAARTVTFDSNTTQTIAAGGALTMTGAASNLLTLASSSPGTHWNLTHGGASQNVQYVSVADSDANSGAAITALSATDGGNNHNWTFLSSNACSSGSTWQSYTSGGWSTAGTWLCDVSGAWYISTSGTPGSGDTATIKNGHSISISGNVSVATLAIDAGGTFTSSGALTVAATTLTVNGTYVNGSTGAITGTMSVGAGGTYQHSVDSATTSVIPTATWDPNSTVLIQGLTLTNLVTAGGNQNFGNLTINLTNHTSDGNIFAPTAYPTSITGNLTIQATGGSTYHQHLTNPSTVTSYTFSIGKDLILTGGRWEFGHSTGTAIYNIGGSYIQTGGGIGKWHSSGGTLTLNFTGTKSGGPWNIAGNLANSTSGHNRVYNVNAAYTLSNNVTLNTPSSGYTSAFNVPGSGTGSLDLGAYTFTGTNTYTNTITVGSNGTLYVGGGSNFPSGFTSYTLTNGTVNYNRAGTQTVSAQTYGNLTLSGSGAKTTTGATVNAILSMEGTATTTGTVATYGAAATLQYKGSSAQTTGTEFPATFAGTGGVIINNVSGVALGGSKAITNGLALTSGAFGVGANTLTLNGAVSATSGSLTSAATGTVSYNKSSSGQNVLAANYGNLTFSNQNKTLPASGTIGVAGTFTPGTATGHTVTGSTIDYNGGSQTIGSWVYYNNIVLSGSGTKTLGGAIAMAGNWNNNSNLSLAGNYTATFNGTGAQSISGSTNWYGLAVTTSSARSVSFQSGSTQSVANSLVLTGAASNLLTLASSSPGTHWNLNRNSGGSLSASYVSVADSDASFGAEITAPFSTDGGNNHNWFFPVGNACSSGVSNWESATSGDWGVSGTWMCQKSGVWYLSTSITPTTGIPISILSGDIVTVAANATVDQVTINAGGQVTIRSGSTLTINNGTGTDLTVNGTLVNSDTLTLNGTMVVGAGGEYQHARSGGTIPTATWDSASTVNITGATSAIPAGNQQAFGNYTWNCPSQSAELTLFTAGFHLYGNLTVAATGSNHIDLADSGQTTFAIDGDLNLNGGIFEPNPGTMTISVGGNYNAATDQGLRDSNGGTTWTLNFTGTGKTISGQLRATTSNTISIPLTIASGASVSLNNALTGNTGISGDLTVNGTFDLGAYTADRSASGGTLTLGSAGSLKIGGTNTTLPINYSTHAVNATSTIEYSGASQTVATLNSSQNYGNLVLNGSDTKTLAGVVGVAGNLTVADVTFDLGSYTANRTSAGGTLTLASGGGLKIGSTNTLPTNYSTHVINVASTIEYSGASQTIATLNSSQKYGNLTLSGSGTKTLAGAIGVVGDWSNSSSLVLAGNYAVTFSGAGSQNITGSNTWYDLAVTTSTPRTVSFQDGATQSVAHNLTLTGTAGNLLTLAPLTGSAWNLTMTGASQSVSYVSVSYSDASGGVLINAANGTNSNGDNNTNWLFNYYVPTVTKTFTPASIVSGGTSSLVIIVTNPAGNPVNLTGVSIDDIYTGTLVNNAAGGVVCSGGGSATLTGGANSGVTVGFSGGVIVPGGSCTITQSVTATSANDNTTTAPTATGPVLLTGTAAGPIALDVYAALTVAKVADVSTVNPGGQIVYSITYTNPNSTSYFQNLVITDPVPPFTTFVSADCGTVPAGLTCSDSADITKPAVGGTGTVIWTMGGQLDAAQSGTVHLTVQVQ